MFYFKSILDVSLSSMVIKLMTVIALIYVFKDARSVSWYPNNWSHILQYVKYTKNELTLQKKLQTFMTNKVFWTKM